MSSPFRRRQQMVRGLVSGASVRAAGVNPVAPAAPDADTPAGQEYAALRVNLHDNLRALSDIQSHEARAPKKAEFAKVYGPWIEGVLAAGVDAPASQDEIVATNMIWALDYGDIDYALRLGGHVISHGLTLPESYSRSPACFLAEDIAEAALKDPAAVSHEQLLKANALTADADMPDQARAKLAKAIGRSFAQKAEEFDAAADNAPAGGKAAYATEALDWLKRAIKLDPKAGVKKDIERLERQLREAEKTETPRQDDE